MSEATKRFTHTFDEIPGPSRDEPEAFSGDLLGFLHRAAAQYGDVFRIWSGTGYAVVVHHPDHARQVLKAPAEQYHAAELPVMEVLEPVMGHSLVTTDGPSWLKRRKSRSTFRTS